MPSLDRRVSNARREVEQRRGERPLQQLEQAVAALDPIRPFTESVAGEEISFVVRVKAAEAAVCELAETAEVDALAAAHEPLTGLAAMTQLPLLLTDMVVDRYQLFEARLAGAGGVILIAAAFEDDHDQLGDLYGLAGDLGLDVIVEVAAEQEIDQVLDLLDPDSFLIRNRGEDGDGAVDFERTFSLLEEVPAGMMVVSQGGIRDREAVVELERAGVDAAILGPWAVAGDLADTLAMLRGDAR
jgi:indole-3-glycerol phosphate synthase